MAYAVLAGNAALYLTHARVSRNTCFIYSIYKDGCTNLWPRQHSYRFLIVGRIVIRDLLLFLLPEDRKGTLLPFNGFWELIILESFSLCLGPELLGSQQPDAVRYKDREFYENTAGLLAKVQDVRHCKSAYHKEYMIPKTSSKVV